MPTSVNASSILSRTQEDDAPQSPVAMPSSTATPSDGVGGLLRTVSRAVTALVTQAVAPHPAHYDPPAQHHPLQHHSPLQHSQQKQHDKQHEKQPQQQEQQHPHQQTQHQKKTKKQQPQQGAVEQIPRPRQQSATVPFLQANSGSHRPVSAQDTFANNTTTSLLRHQDTGRAAVLDAERQAWCCLKHQQEVGAIDSGEAADRAHLRAVESNTRRRLLSLMLHQPVVVLQLHASIEADARASLMQEERVAFSSLQHSACVGERQAALRRELRRLESHEARARARVRTSEHHAAQMMLDDERRSATAVRSHLLAQSQDAARQGVLNAERFSRKNLALRQSLSATEAAQATHRGRICAAEANTRRRLLALVPLHHLTAVELGARAALLQAERAQLASLRQSARANERRVMLRLDLQRLEISELRSRACINDEQSNAACLMHEAGDQQRSELLQVATLAALEQFEASFRDQIVLSEAKKVAALTRRASAARAARLMKAVDAVIVEEENGRVALARERGAFLGRLVMSSRAMKARAQRETVLVERIVGAEACRRDVILQAESAAAQKLHDRFSRTLEKQRAAVAAVERKRSRALSEQSSGHISILEFESREFKRIMALAARELGELQFYERKELIACEREHRSEISKDRKATESELARHANQLTSLLAQERCANDASRSRRVEAVVFAESEAVAVVTASAEETAFRDLTRAAEQQSSVQQSLFVSTVTDEEHDRATILGEHMIAFRDLLRAVHDELLFLTQESESTHRRVLVEHASAAFSNIMKDHEAVLAQQRMTVAVQAITVSASNARALVSVTEEAAFRDLVRAAEQQTSAILGAQAMEQLIAAEASHRGVVLEGEAHIFGAVLLQKERMLHNHRSVAAAAFQRRTRHIVTSETTQRDRILVAEATALRKIIQKTQRSIFGSHAQNQRRLELDEESDRVNILEAESIALEFIRITCQDLCQLLLREAHHRTEMLAAEFSAFDSIRTSHCAVQGFGVRCQALLLNEEIHRIDMVGDEVSSFEALCESHTPALQDALAREYRRDVAEKNVLACIDDECHDRHRHIHAEQDAIQRLWKAEAHGNAAVVATERMRCATMTAEMKSRSTIEKMRVTEFWRIVETAKDDVSKIRRLEEVQNVMIDEATARHEVLKAKTVDEEAMCRVVLLEFEAGALRTLVASRTDSHLSENQTRSDLQNHLRGVHGAELSARAILEHQQTEVFDWIHFTASSARETILAMTRARERAAEFAASLEHALAEEATNRSQIVVAEADGRRALIASMAEMTMAHIRHNIESLHGSQQATRRTITRRQVSEFQALMSAAKKELALIAERETQLRAAAESLEQALTEEATHRSQIVDEETGDRRDCIAVLTDIKMKHLRRMIGSVRGSEQSTRSSTMRRQVSEFQALMSAAKKELALIAEREAQLSHDILQAQRAAEFAAGLEQTLAEEATHRSQVVDEEADDRRQWIAALTDIRVTQLRRTIASVRGSEQATRGSTMRRQVSEFRALLSAAKKELASVCKRDRLSISIAQTQADERAAEFAASLEQALAEEAMIRSQIVDEEADNRHTLIAPLTQIEAKWRRRVGSVCGTQQSARRSITRQQQSEFRTLMSTAKKELALISECEARLELAFAASLERALAEEATNRSQIVVAEADGRRALIASMTEMTMARIRHNIGSVCGTQQSARGKITRQQLSEFRTLMSTAQKELALISKRQANVRAPVPPQLHSHTTGDETSAAVAETHVAERVEQNGRTESNTKPVGLLQQGAGQSPPRCGHFNLESTTVVSAHDDIAMQTFKHDEAKARRRIARRQQRAVDALSQQIACSPPQRIVIAEERACRSLLVDDAAASLHRQMQRLHVLTPTHIIRDTLMFEELYHRAVLVAAEMQEALDCLVLFEGDCHAAVLIEEFNTRARLMHRFVLRSCSLGDPSSDDTAEAARNTKRQRDDDEDTCDGASEGAAGHGPSAVASPPSSQFADAVVARRRRRIQCHKRAEAVPTLPTSAMVSATRETSSVQSKAGSSRAPDEAHEKRGRSIKRTREDDETFNDDDENAGGFDNDGRTTIATHQGFMTADDYAFDTVGEYSVPPGAAAPTMDLMPPAGSVVAFDKPITIDQTTVREALRTAPPASDGMEALLSTLPPLPHHSTCTAVAEPMIGRDQVATDCLTAPVDTHLNGSVPCAADPIVLPQSSSEMPAAITTDASVPYAEDACAEGAALKVIEEEIFTFGPRRPSSDNSADPSLQAALVVPDFSPVMELQRGIELIAAIAASATAPFVSIDDSPCSASATLTASDTTPCASPEIPAAQQFERKAESPDRNCSHPRKAKGGASVSGAPPTADIWPPVRVPWAPQPPPTSLHQTTPPVRDAEDEQESSGTEEDTAVTPPSVPPSPPTPEAAQIVEEHSQPSTQDWCLPVPAQDDSNTPTSCGGNVAVPHPRAPFAATPACTAAWPPVQVPWNAPTWVPPMGCNTSPVDERPLQLAVFGLPPTYTDGTVRELFEGFGQLNGTRIIRDKVTGAPKGLAFVHFQRHDDAVCALRTCDGVILPDGTKLTVSFARDQRPPYRDRRDETMDGALSSSMSQPPSGTLNTTAVTAITPTPRAGAAQDSTTQPHSLSACSMGQTRPQGHDDSSQSQLRQAEQAKHDEQPRTCIVDDHDDRPTVTLHPHSSLVRAPSESNPHPFAAMDDDEAVPRSRRQQRRGGRGDRRGDRKRERSPRRTASISPPLVSRFVRRPSG